ncbi:MAG: nitrous oxide-stimulated promoter family protein [Smithella sp.]
MKQEIKTVGLMIEFFCHGQHDNKGGPCLECRELFEYVIKRLEKCPLKDNKPKCSKCTVPCYKSDMGEKIKAVMKYAGHRMLCSHLITTGEILSEEKIKDKHLVNYN